MIAVTRPGHAEPLPIESGPEVCDQQILTAAFTRAAVMTIATVERIGRELIFRPDRSGFYELSGRDQDKLLSFSDTVRQTLSTWDVRHVLLRVSPLAGSFMAKAVAYKAEAALQLIDELRVDIVPSQTIRAWTDRFAPELPEPAAEVGRTLGSYLTSAIETAVYGLQSTHH